MSLFCPSCSAYIPAGRACPRCGRGRPAIHIPTPPDRPCWQATVPGNPAPRLALAHLDGRPVILLPWGYQPAWNEPGQPDGGLTILSLEDGQELHTIRLGRPVEGITVTSSPFCETGTGSPGEWVLLTTASIGVGAGQGEIMAFDLGQLQVKWRKALGGAVRAAPAVYNLRVYVAACDGYLYCLDLRNGDRVWRDPVRVFDRPTQIPASPLIARERGVLQAIIVATYGSTGRRLPGRVVAVDEAGHLLWTQEAGGHARGTPVAARGQVYVTTYRDQPSAGALMAFDPRSGEPAWEHPFVIQAQPGERRLYNLSTSPLYHRGTLYVGSLNHRLYALDAETGKVQWELELGGGIATTPALVEGLLIVGANDGKVYAIDPEQQAVAWAFDLGAPVLSEPLITDDLIVAAAHNGTVVVLPWHLGHYIWAAERLQRAGRRTEAADCHALAAHFGLSGTDQKEGYDRAAQLWEEAGEPEKAGELWLALGRLKEAAQAFRHAGEVWRGRDPCRAVAYFRRAADLYFRLRLGDELNECTRALARCAGLPFVWIQPVNVPNFVQWEAGEFALRLIHEGERPIRHGIRLFLGGSLKNLVQVEIPRPFEPGAMWHIPITLEATKLESELEVELEYDSGEPGLGPLRQILRIPIQAAEPRQPPPSIHVGDVGLLRVEVSPNTAEGLPIHTRDIGVLRANGPVGQVNVMGDAGAVISRYHTEDMEAPQDVRQGWPGAPVQCCPSCGQPVGRGQKYCIHCGTGLAFQADSNDGPVP